MLTIDKDKQCEWRKALRLFKQGIKARAKLGVLDTISQQVSKERKGKSQWDAPYWAHEEWLTLLYTSIKHNEFSTKLLTGLVKGSEVTFFATTTQPTTEQILMYVDIVCRMYSKQIRQKFGVFV